MKEREAKLVAPPGFDLPRLGGPEDAYVAEPQSAKRLQTTYYDTADLRLARWGASLRYRPSEGWTVKLPEGQAGALLVRAEHVFSGDGRRPPAEAVALVRPFVRTGRLSPVVRMRTLRRRVAAGRAGRRRGPGAGRAARRHPLPRARGRAGRGGRRRPARAGGGAAARGRGRAGRADPQVPARPRRPRADARARDRPPGAGRLGHRGGPAPPRPGHQHPAAVPPRGRGPDRR